MGKQWNWPFEVFHWIFCIFSHCKFHFFRHLMTTFNFRGLPDCFVRMIRFFVILGSLSRDILRRSFAPIVFQHELCHLHNNFICGAGWKVFNHGWSLLHLHCFILSSAEFFIGPRVQFILFHEPCSDLTLCCLQCHHQRPLLFSTQCHPPVRTFKVRIYDMDNQMIDGGEQLHSNEFKNLSKRRTQTKRGTTFLEKKKRNYLSVEQSEEWYRGMGGHFPSSLKMVNNDNKL